MENDLTGIIQDCLKKLNQELKSLKTLNVVLIGKSGAGKSTLINGVFHGNLADTGLGRPVTREIRLIEKRDFPLRIYDTPGFELSAAQQQAVKEGVLHLIENGYKSLDINQTIHCLWYCINTAGNRTFDETELNWIREVAAACQTADVPVMVILTQSFQKKKAQEMKKLVEKENLPIVQVIPVLAQDMEIDENYIVPSYGLDRLVRVLSENFPPDLKLALLHLQKVDIESKKQYSQKVVINHIVMAAAATAIPIPVADSIALVSIQMNMLVSISVAFGINLTGSFLMAVAGLITGLFGTSIGGRALAGALLKMIPGAGSVGSAVISVSTAVTLTWALGETFILLMEQIFRGEYSQEDFQTKKGKEFISKTFEEQYRQGLPDQIQKQFGLKPEKPEEKKSEEAKTKPANPEKNSSQKHQSKKASKSHWNLPNLDFSLPNLNWNLPNLDFSFLTNLIPNMGPAPVSSKATGSQKTDPQTSSKKSQSKVPQQNQNPSEDQKIQKEQPDLARTETGKERK